jgi:hypothetical protein
MGEKNSKNFLADFKKTQAAINCRKEERGEQVNQ